MAQLREAFSAEHALQCGYCTPGMLATARDIVLRLPQADEAVVDADAPQADDDEHRNHHPEEDQKRNHGATLAAAGTLAMARKLQARAEIVAWSNFLPAAASRRHRRDGVSPYRVGGFSATLILITPPRKFTMCASAAPRVRSCSSTPRCAG